MPPRVGWETRHAETLDRWPVIGEAWARALEARRTADGEVQPPPPPTGPLKEDREVITPKDAIEMALQGKHRKKR
jgi:hypothetical protein